MRHSLRHRLRHGLRHRLRHTLLNKNKNKTLSGRPWVQARHAHTATHAHALTHATQRRPSLRFGYAFATLGQPPATSLPPLIWSARHSPAKLSIMLKIAKMLLEVLEISEILRNFADESGQIRVTRTR